MAHPLEDEPLQASILDRLTGPKNYGRFAGRQTLEQLIDSVHRDLEALLNTRWRVLSWPDSLEELKYSLANYGIPDFAGLNMSSPNDRELFRGVVEEAIATHEPRILHVKVHVVDSEDRLNRSVNFHIDATLDTTPAPAKVHFDSKVDPTSYRIEINSEQ